jgi:hypothetical protein
MLSGDCKDLCCLLVGRYPVRIVARRPDFLYEAIGGCL